MLLEGKHGSSSASPTSARSRGGSRRPWPAKARGWPSPTRASGSRRTCASWPRASKDPVILPCDVSRDEDLDALADVREARAGRPRLRRPRGGVRAARGAGRRVPEHLARGLPDRAGHLVLLADRAGPPRGAPHGGARGQHRHPELPGRRARGAALQRDGRGQGGARDVGALPGGRPRAAGHPRERHLRRAHQDAGRLRRARALQDARVPPQARAAAQEHRAGRGGRRGAVPGLAPVARRSPARSSTWTAAST